MEEFVRLEKRQYLTLFQQDEVEKGICNCKSDMPFLEVDLKLQWHDNSSRIATFKISETKEDNLSQPWMVKI